MPVYCYQDKQGFIHDMFFNMGEAPKEVDLGARGVAKRCFGAEGKTTPSTTNWPMECVASGVNAAQRGELEKHFREVGVPTKVSADGNPIYESASHRRKALSARGFVDKSSFN